MLCSLGRCEMQTQKAVSGISRPARIDNNSRTYFVATLFELQK
jgi:hypothetical protein